MGELSSDVQGKVAARGKARPLRCMLVLLGVPLGIFLCVNTLFVLRGIERPSFRLIKHLYTFNTVLMPLLWLVSGVVGVIVWRRRREERWLFRSLIACFIAALCCVGARLYVTHVEPHRLVLREVTIRTPKTERSVRILHISDIQSPAVGPYEERAFARIRELQPDLVLHTGDLLQPQAPATFRSELPKISALFQTLNPPLGIYGVYGDVDWPHHRFPDDDIGGMRMLEAEEAAITLDGMRLRILGLSRNQSRGRQKTKMFVERWLKDAAPNDLTIILGHAPDYVLSIRDLPVDLCLAGHTHGGQVRIPFYGAVVTLSRVPRAWARGYREVGRTRLNVSAGIGSEHVAGLQPIRLNCPTEMTLIRIEPE